MKTLWRNFNFKKEKNETNSYKKLEPGVALITGGAKRIGKKIAKNLARDGWKVVIHYNKNNISAKKLKGEIIKNKGSAEIIKCDLNNYSSVKNLIEKSKEKFGSLSLLINNASKFENDDISKINSDSWDSHNNINLKAPLFLSRDFSKQIKKGAPGIIINIIDQRIFFPNPEFISYTSSKQSLMWLTQTLAQALSPQIRVCAIGPGPTLQGARQSKKDFENQSLSTPLMIGSNPEEIYQAVKFIIDMPSFTGQMITLDGGEHLDWIKKEDKNFKD